MMKEGELSNLEYLGDIISKVFMGIELNAEDMKVIGELGKVYVPAYEKDGRRVEFQLNDVSKSDKTVVKYMKRDFIYEDKGML